MSHDAKIEARHAPHTGGLRRVRPSSRELVQLLRSELAQTNSQVMELALELDKRVEERTSQLEAANKELESFSYSVSHDLRAPLRAISGFAELLERQFGPQLPEDGRELLERLAGSARQMNQLINDLLRFSRLGRQHLSKAPVNTSALVREILQELQPEYAGRKVDIRLGSLPDCRGDRALLHQVFTNLLSNAFKFTRNKDAAVVEVSSCRQDGELVYFVRDNGAGFDMGAADKLFGVFQRLHTTEEFEGTGIGLSIVQRIIRRHGGRVWAEGAVDQGATFYFTLPDGDGAV